MTNAATARMLTRYKAWANKVFFDAVRALPVPAKPPTTGLTVFLRDVPQA